MVDWELVDRYLAGECTPEERRRVELWIAVNPERATRLGLVTDALQHEPAHDSNDPWREVERRIGAMAGSVLPAHRRSRGWKPVAKAAAVLVAVGGAAVAARLTLPSAGRGLAEAAPPRVIESAVAQRVDARLPDGTLVSLAPASTLRIDPSFGTAIRTVDLEGEAVFTVRHDAERPFSVRTRSLTANDLGTHFIVRAYAGEAGRVAVAEGAVAVAPSVGWRAEPGSGSPADSIVLRAGEGVGVDDAGRIERASRADVERMFAWTEGKLVFDDTPLAAAATDLERWRGVTIRLEGRGVTTRRLTASFERESAQEILRVIAAALDLTLRSEGGEYTLAAQ